MANIPPRTVVLKWCPRCGRNDRHTPFTGDSHFSRGKRCPGKLKTVYYMKDSVHNGS